MRSDIVRSTFLDFFAKNGHQRVRSAPLVPVGDSTLLFTNAGMVPFKNVFTGAETRTERRATSSQKCVRAGGKHNDLDEVGKTARHHTFFEMLGNFSFGDYFKKEAIGWAWELLTQVYHLDPNRLIITVFGGDPTLKVAADDEARQLWRETTDLPAKRIVGLGAKENFWMMGDTGPMGPCSEIHYYMGSGEPPQLPLSTDPDSAWEPWLEIWNLVFMQYERTIPGGPLAPLPAPSIDTGAGLERLTAILSGVSSNYDTDLFKPLLKCAADVAGKTYGQDESADISMRVIADHARASSFLIADGVFPDKTNQEYVLRRIFRRAVRHGKLLGITEPFMYRVCEAVVDHMKGAFPELEERASTIRELALEEEKRFRATLDRGLERLDAQFIELKKSKTDVVPGSEVFFLYDTLGFPDDLTEIIAHDNGFTIDKLGFRQELEQARSRSRAGRDGNSAQANDLNQLTSGMPPSSFVGYDPLGGVSGTGTVLKLVSHGKELSKVEKGEEFLLVTNETPFYAESGGQIGDQGVAESSSGAKIKISDCQKSGEHVFVHRSLVVAGTISVQDQLEMKVDRIRRDQIRANHSATHLLNLALRQILGDHVVQKGSLVTDKRLRFDFAHSSPLTEEQRCQIEDHVNAEIRANTESLTEVLTIDTAKKRGAIAMFGEKYGETVRVVRIGRESLEFCGGTHVGRTGDIGLFKLTGESGIAQGVRRIEAVTGAGALAYVRKLEEQLNEVGKRLRVKALGVAERVEKLQSDAKALERTVSQLKLKLASGGSRDLLSELVEIGGVKVLATSTEIADAKALRATGDQLRDKLGSGIIVLAGVADKKVSLLAMVTNDLTSQFHAGTLLKAVAEVVGGRGGGRPDMAQGGGTQPDKVNEALARAIEVITEISTSA